MGRSDFADGEWHRLHPLTPLFRGGLVLLIVGGIVLSNMRERIGYWFVEQFVPDAGHIDFGGDPVDWVVTNDLLLISALVVLGVVALLVAMFWLVWRFHTFRITGDHVEVRRGIVFRSHRRAPLDRVQGVDLTRPFPARLAGMAKLQVVGAGTDANVPLEYLSTAQAEAVRAEILRRASGARRAREAARGEGHVMPDGGATAGGEGSSGTAHRGPGLGSTVSSGVSGLIEGVDLADIAPESVLRVPSGRVVVARLLSALLGVVVFGAIGAIAVLVITLLSGSFWAGAGGLIVLITTAVPIVIAFGAVALSRILKQVRYSIGSTPDGLRVTFGLFTTVTETLPPGRIHAVSISQPLIWRPFGWWTVRVNRMSGASAAQASSGSGQFHTVLPVGTRDEVERVVALLLPEMPVADLPLVYAQGIAGPVPGVPDAYLTMAARGWWRRPLSWRRQGFVLTSYALLIRRGRLWRSLSVLPLARLQGISVEQGPIDRLQRVGAARAHTIAGPVSGMVVGVDQQALMTLLQEATRAAVIAAAQDRTHRWAQHGSVPVPVPVPSPVPAPEAGDPHPRTGSDGGPEGDSPTGRSDGA